MPSPEMGDEEAGCIEMIAESMMGESLDQHEEITPLLEIHKPKMTIFSVSYPNRKPKEPLTKEADSEFFLFYQFILWIWGESRYSGILCMAFSSMIYSIMELLSDIFPVRPVPLLEIIFARCTIILISSFFWLRSTRQSVFGPPHVRSLLIARSIVGFLSLLSFIYSVHTLPVSDAIILNFTTPIIASIVARVIFREKLAVMDIGGFTCSFLGLLLIFRPMLFTHGGLLETSESSEEQRHHFYGVVVGLFSAITGGINYCLIRAGAKASDQPVVTVFAFGLLATPATALCTFVFQKFVVPDFYSSLSMVLHGVLALFAEVFLARGLQLEKMSKVVNIQYIEAILSQIVSLLLLRVSPSFLRVAGCMLITVSVLSTLYIGPERGLQ